ncbi:shikimate kinase [Flavobacteriaceae bacterium XHP0103]|uniref:shikimate kinase n=1 Tax=Marixanthotalea marina TaxID=2844359 RepID=UPI002989D1A4|nr:shikimate kinase [Marixanthotalea marina]MBU3821422.1 shikimate kinase [Marixanthotalea marina]
MNVILIGYMASGKSSVGKILAEKLKFEFIDLDDYIEMKEQDTIKHIFKKKGEIYFRKLETKYLKEILESQDNVVLSLGGGTPCYGNNMHFIRENKNAKSIYFKTSIPTLVDRLKTEKAKRPLIAHIDSDEMLVEFIGKHLFERSQFYNLAEITVTTDNKTKKQIVEDVLLALF